MTHSSISKLIDPITISKPWGYEIWIADGKRTPYANKRIFFKAGNKTSLQVHKYKFETNYVLEGYGTLLISDKFFDVDLYLSGNMSGDDLNNYITNLTSIILTPGTIFDVNPGYLHRVIATSDLTFIETSTPELDDVIRLLDDTNRTHGKIDAEHK